MDIGAYEFAITGLVDIRTARAPSEAVPQVSPNPFFGQGFVRGREREWFVVCDRAGRRVGGYAGGGIGADLCPGVYLLLDPARPGCAVPFVKLGRGTAAGSR
jgi:hypothetical protein